MSIDQDWITSYLDDEAARVIVDDRLEEIELGITLSGIDAGETIQPRRFSIVVAAAATIAIIAIGLGVLADRPTSSGPVQASANVEPTESSEGQPDTTPAPEPITQIAVTPANELPPGGLALAGQQPTCTMVNADVYTCTLASSYDPAGDALYEIGLVTYYTDSSSLVAGGCRTTTADARNWICYVGGRAVVEATVTPNGVGELYLGQPALNAYAAG